MGDFELPAGPRLAIYSPDRLFFGLYTPVTKASEPHVYIHDEAGFSATHADPLLHPVPCLQLFVRPSGRSVKSSQHPNKVRSAAAFALIASCAASRRPFVARLHQALNVPFVDALLAGPPAAAGPPRWFET